MEINYNQENRSFSGFSNKAGNLGWGDIAKIAGISAVLSIAPAVIKVIARKYGNKTKDRILYARNERLNRLQDEYAKSGATPTASPALAAKYADEIHALIEDTIYLTKTRMKDGNRSDINITVNQDQYGDTKSVSKTYMGGDSIMDLTIAPFLVVLKMILVRGVHVLAGTTLGADRRNFELVYDPNESKPERVAKDPYRMVIFKHKWPSHGFEVKTMGENEANDLINDTVDFLAHNPKYLSIRVK